MIRMIALTFAGVFTIASSGAFGQCHQSRPAPCDSYQEVQQSRRYLRVKNETGQTLTFFVRYRTLNVRDEWKWYPESQTGEDQAVRFELEPGAEADLEHEGFQINASRVRIWGELEDGQEIDDYKDQDLWLVPEIHGDDEHCYYADEMETFTFTFEK
jgi:hypothetical protein